MKFKRLLQSSIALTAASSIALLYLTDSPALSLPTDTGAKDLQDTIAPNISQRSMEGTFEAIEAPTSGKAQIVKEDGIRYLLIDSSFNTTDQAPDLHVLLDTANQPPEKYDDSQSGRYVNLGKIQNTMGEQRYPIPDSVDLSQQKSVVIWCRMANATMGFATLKESSTALAE